MQYLKNNVAEFRIRIAKYRAMARLPTDRETAENIHFADEYRSDPAD